MFCFFFGNIKADLFSRSKKMFNPAVLKTKWGCRFSGDVNTINLLNEKEKYFKGEITIGHCKGHGCIILFLILKDFTKTIDDCGQKFLF